LIQIGGALQPDELIGHDDGVAVDHWDRQAIGTPAERENSEETSGHSATVRYQISGRARVGGYLVTME
jgi:hypothetical protein